MNLLGIKNYLKTVNVVSLANLSLYFNSDPETLRQMLKHWMRKGCVRQCNKTPACGKTCGKCEIAVTELYEWVWQ